MTNKPDTIHFWPTPKQVYSTFSDIDVETRVRSNWGSGTDNSIWHIDDDHYINGIMLTIDEDYQMGYLLEVMSRSFDSVNWLFVKVQGFGVWEAHWLTDLAKYLEDTDRQQVVDASLRVDLSTSSLYTYFVRWYEQQPGPACRCATCAGAAPSGPPH